MPLPRYKKLHQQLRADILSGRYEEGSLLPSENTLSAQHNMTRVMVRQALSALEQEGYILKHQGKGSIVKGEGHALGLLSFRGFSDVVEKTAHTAVTHFLTPPYHTSWDQDFFFELAAQEKTEGCIVIERLRQVDTHPVMLEYTYLPAWGVPNFCRQTWVQNSLFRSLSKHYQLVMTNVDQQLRAVVASATVAEHLKITTDTPVLHIYRKYKTNRAGYFVYSSLFCSTQHYAISNILS